MTDRNFDYDMGFAAGSRYEYLDDEPRPMATYEFRSDGLSISDPVWGNWHIGYEEGDQVLIDVLHHPAMRRMAAIEQLTLSARYSTMPNTSGYSRWEGSWGGVVLTRRLLEGIDITPREKVIYQLRALLADIGQTAYSHLGDWRFQGVGGPENKHDEDLKAFVVSTGLGEILDKHRINIDEVIFPAVQDFTEADKPVLCTDRVDYGLRQILRCFNFDGRVNKLREPGVFQLVEIDGTLQMVMNNQANAKLFANLFALLPTEHWGEPTQRMQLLLLQELVTDQLLSGGTNLTDGFSKYLGFNPRDYMYTVDWDFEVEHHAPNSFQSILGSIMVDIGRAKRRTFATIRRPQLSRWYHDGDHSYLPDPHDSSESDLFSGHPLASPQLDIVLTSDVSEIDDFGGNPNAIDYLLKPLSRRWIDPAFLEDGEVKVLSVEDPEFRSLLESQKQIQSRLYIGRLLVNKILKERLASRIGDNNQAWAAALNLPRMAPEVFGQLIRDAGGMALPLYPGMIRDLA